MAEFTWPWEQDAMAGRELPDGLSLPDQAAYTALRNIYDAYHRKAIPRDVAAAEKRKVRRSWEQLTDGLEFQDKLNAAQVRLNKASELAKAAVLKDPTPENALRLVRIMDGLERP